MQQEVFNGLLDGPWSCTRGKETLGYIKSYSSLVRGPDPGGGGERGVFSGGGASETSRTRDVFPTQGCRQKLVPYIVKVSLPWCGISPGSLCGLRQYIPYRATSMGNEACGHGEWQGERGRVYLRQGHLGCGVGDVIASA